ATASSPAIAWATAGGAEAAACTARRFRCSPMLRATSWNVALFEARSWCNVVVRFAVSSGRIARSMSGMVVSPRSFRELSCRTLVLEHLAGLVLDDDPWRRNRVRRRVDDPRAQVLNHERRCPGKTLSTGDLFGDLQRLGPVDDRIRDAPEPSNDSMDQEH